MNAITGTGSAGLLARYDALKSSLPGDPAIREEAARAFRMLGLPGTGRGRRAEAWKYTSLAPLADMSFGVDAATATPAHPANGEKRLVLRGGRFMPQSSTSVPGFTRFADAPDFGLRDRLPQDPVLALNTMLAADGVVLHAPSGSDLGVVQLQQIGAAGSSAHPRHRISLGAGARLTLVEHCVGDGDYLQNPVFEIDIAEQAVLTHIRLLDDAPAAVNLTGIAVSVAARGQYDHFTLSLGGRITRTELHAVVNGPQAVVQLNGAQLLRGTQHGDFTSVVCHAAPNGTSRQAVRSVLADRAHGVFQGRIEVARVAQKTDGYQRSSTLLLSPQAEMDTKPELEIFADDVKCSHGATIGELDVDQLFYLRSRGIPDAEARSLLVRAFLAEALEAVADESIRGTLDTAVQRWWEKQAV